jgi:hypothetical protein
MFLKQFQESPAYEAFASARDFSEHCGPCRAFQPLSRFNLKVKREFNWSRTVGRLKQRPHAIKSATHVSVLLIATQRPLGSIHPNETTNNVISHQRDGFPLARQLSSGE